MCKLLLDYTTPQCANYPLRIKCSELKQLFQLFLCEVPQALLIALAKAICLQGHAISSHFEEQSEMIADCRTALVQCTIDNFVHVEAILCD